MKVLVLGGCGLQGRAVLYDLSRSPQVSKIVCADIDFEALEPVRELLDHERLELVRADIGDRDLLISLMEADVDVVVDMLPAAYLDHVAEAALAARVDLVNTMYGHMMNRSLDARAKERGITILPEAGLDPGIDLILCGYGASQLDEVHEIHSSCGGIPEREAADNPLKYKLTWTWDGVLKSYKRPAVMLEGGELLHIPPAEQHAEEWVKTIHFPGLGQLESVPNGDAVVFAEYLGVAHTVTDASRRFLRWPGHSALWRTFEKLGFLSDEPVPGLDCGITPHEFMVKHLGPRLQYGDAERDLVVMRNVVGGKKDGEKLRIVFDLVDTRDLETGFFAMNRTVGYTASIAAQLVFSGVIQRRGLLTAVRDIPYEPFLRETEARGIRITRTEERSPKGNP